MKADQRAVGSNRKLWCDICGESFDDSWNTKAVVTYGRAYYFCDKCELRAHHAIRNAIEEERRKFLNKQKLRKTGGEK